MGSTTKRHFSEEFKRDTVALIDKEGYSLKESSSRLGIHESVLGKWRRRIRRAEQTVAGIVEVCEPEYQQENRALKEENRRLKME